jgi:hypothetical protein
MKRFELKKVDYGLLPEWIRDRIRLGLRKFFTPYCREGNMKEISAFIREISVEDGSIESSEHAEFTDNELIRFKMANRAVKISIPLFASEIELFQLSGNRQLAIFGFQRE